MRAKACSRQITLPRTPAQTATAKSADQQSTPADPPPQQTGQGVNQPSNNPGPNGGDHSTNQAPSDTGANRNNQRPNQGSSDPGPDRNDQKASGQNDESNKASNIPSKPSSKVHQSPSSEQPSPGSLPQPSNQSQRAQPGNSGNAGIPDVGTGQQSPQQQGQNDASAQSGSSNGVSGQDSDGHAAGGASPSPSPGEQNSLAGGTNPKETYKLPAPPAPVPAVSVAGYALKPVAYGVVIVSDTSTRGGSAVNIAGTPVFLDSNNQVHIGNNAYNIPVVPAAPTTTLPNGVPAVILPNAVSIHGTTLTMGGPAATVSGNVVSFGPANDLVYAQAATRPSNGGFGSVPTLVTTIDGQAITADSAKAMLPSTTLTPGGPAATAGSV